MSLLSGIKQTTRREIVSSYSYNHLVFRKKKLNNKLTKSKNHFQIEIMDLMKLFNLPKAEPVTHVIFDLDGLLLGKF